MTRFRALAIAGLLAATAALTGAAPASAKITNLERRNGAAYYVSPAMMHAIDVIVAEKMKMAHRRR